MKERLVAIGLFLSLLLASSGNAQVDRTREVETLMNALNSGSSAQRVQTAKVITQSGIENGALYEKVADLLRAGYSKGYNSDHVDEMSWLCKALSASGDATYKVLLEEIAEKAPSSKLKHYALQSIDMIDEYAQRIEILKSTEIWQNDLSAEENRLLNMLSSDNVQLKKDAAKTIVRSIKVHNKIYDVVAAELLSMLADGGSGSKDIDTMAWLCKALAASGDSKYEEPLKQVETGAENSKLKMYASRALKQLN